MDNIGLEKGPPLAKVGRLVRKVFHEQAFTQHGVHSSATDTRSGDARGLLSKISQFIGTQDNRLRAASGEDFAQRTLTDEAVSPWRGERDRKLDELAEKIDLAPGSIHPSDLADIFAIQINSLQFQLTKQQKVLSEIHPNYKKERVRVQNIIRNMKTDKELLSNLLSATIRRATGQTIQATEQSILFNHLRTQVVSWKGIAAVVERTRPELAKKYLKYALAYQEILSKLMEGKIQSDFSSKRRFMLIDEVRTAIQRGL